MEDYARIIDYIPQGHPSEKGYTKEALAYGVGEEEFKLFELVPKSDAIVNMGDRVYIGKEGDQRDAISHVKRRVGYEDLTSAAQAELPFVIQEIADDSEARFVRFFNESQPISTRYHMLELLPGLGKKTMWAIIEERKKGNFTSYEDISKRIPAIKAPSKLVAKRIEEELSDPTQKYRIFTSK